MPPTPKKTDSFIVSVSDGHGGSVAVLISVAIAPANAAPTGTANPGNPERIDGVVTEVLPARTRTVIR